MNNIFVTIIKRNIFALTANRSFTLNTCKRTVDKNIVESLERLALVDFSTEAGIKRLEQSIQFADNLMEVDTSGVEPLISTVYDKNENIRKDTVTEKSIREELVKIAPVTEEFYYVAPLGTFSRKSHESSS